ncbi:unnamed protein product [Microthlaspi erraticum]|uniref:Uncharacterized protein n=1 Tax=Microthlaspi erraticum TaxID=1685480 RepID=A0A6D2KX53_9BRAS|nr:unnamed protein product [Microthlaspi erraticum]
MVLCFDLEMETFEWFSHPAMVHGSLVQVFRLTDLQGTLVMVDFSSEECVGLWTLRDKARGEWSFDYRFDAKALSDKVRHFCRGHDDETGRLHVVGAWKEGLLLRIWDSTVCFYLNLKTERMEYIGFEKKVQELVRQDFIVAYTPNYLLRLKTYYDQSRVICAHPHAGARLRGRLHLMLTRDGHLAYELRYYYDSIKSPLDELIGFRYGKSIQHPPKTEIKDSVWTFEDM